jgi:NAD(P)-dependent dehydrogenase (short-subunit alcohol dehydrogenase family)
MSAILRLSGVSKRFGALLAVDNLKSLKPIGRMGKIDEVVDAVMYLNDAKFVKGEVLHVDGGAHAGKW